MTAIQVQEHNLYRAFARFKETHEISTVAKRLGKNPDTFKGKLNPNQERTVTFNEFRQLVALDCEEGSSNLINGFVRDYGYQVVPVNVSPKADLQKTFLKASQAMGHIALELQESRPTRSGTNHLVSSVEALVASAMTIGYAAEQRFGGMTMSMIFGDVVTSGLPGVM